MTKHILVKNIKAKALVRIHGEFREVESRVASGKFYQIKFKGMDNYLTFDAEDKVEISTCVSE